MSVAKSDKLRREYDDAEEVRDIGIPVLGRGKIKVQPITTLNDWVVILQFARESQTIALPANMEHLDRGMVVGVSQTIMAADGSRVPSQLQIGDVVLFQEKSKVKDLDWPEEPYLSRKLIVISERNLFLRLPAVGFEIYEPGMATASDFTAK